MIATGYDPYNPGPSPSPTDVPSPVATPAPSPSVTATPEPTQTPEPTVEPSPTPEPNATVNPTPEPSHSTTPSPTPSTTIGTPEFPPHLAETGADVVPSIALALGIFALAAVAIWWSKRAERQSGDYSIPTRVVCLDCLDGNHTACGGGGCDCPTPAPLVLEASR